MYKPRFKTDLKAQTISFDTEDEEGIEKVIILPGKPVVCSRCNGTGRHTNPSVDGHGISREEFDQDPQFLEDYLSGVYDVTCYECKGERVVLDVDRVKAKREDLEQWDAYLSDMAEAQAEYMAERRMGA